MKLIDRQGKLFGWINILDLFLIVLLLAAGAFAAMKFLGTDSGPVSFGGSEQKKITYVLYNSNEFPFVIDRVKIGDTLKSVNTNGILGQVVGVTTDQSMAYVATTDGKMILSPVPEKKEILITVETTATISGGHPLAGGEQLLVGNRLKVKGPDYQIEVIISSAELGGS